MTADDEFTVETVRAHLKMAGLPVPDEDVAALVHGARRTRAMAEGVRRLVSTETEPASVFAPKAARP
jgi:hypothetical protein